MVKPLTTYLPILGQRITLQERKLCGECRKIVEKALYNLKHG